MNKHLATISILMRDRQANVDGLQHVLTENGHQIRTRLGVNLEPTCLAHCLGFIVLVAEGSKEELETLTKKISDLKGVSASLTIVTE